MWTYSNKNVQLEKNKAEYWFTRFLYLTSQGNICTNTINYGKQVIELGLHRHNTTATHSLNDHGILEGFYMLTKLEIMWQHWSNLNSPSFQLYI